MPNINDARITSGTGSIYFANTVSATTTTETTTSNTTTTILDVTGQNTGNGIGLYLGLVNTSNGETLDFKSLLGGIGISLTDLGSAVLITATGEIAPQYFIDLVDGPGDILADSLLISNGTTKLGWLTPSANGSVLVYSDNSIAWASIQGLTTTSITGDGNIVVVTDELSNGVDFSLSLSNTTVTPGTYSLPIVSVDRYGRVTEITNSTGYLTSFNVVSDGNVLASPATIVENTTVSLSLSTTGASAGTYSYPTLVVDQYGRIDGIESGSAPLGSFTISGDSDIGVTGTPAGGVVSLSLLPTTVVAGSYELAMVTVDENGRLIKVSNGVAVTEVSVISGDSNIIVGGNPISNTGTFVVALATTSVAAGTYIYPTIQVDAYGRLQNATSGVNPVAYFSSISANATASIYAGASNSTQYFSSLVASANVSVTVSNPSPFANQVTNSGLIGLDLVDTGVLPGTYNTLIVDSKGRATFGALYEFNFITLVGDVLGNVSSFSPGGYTGGSYVPPTINTTLESILPGPATFVAVVVDSKGRVTAGTTGSAFSNTILTFVGDVSGSGSIINSISLSLANIGSEGTYGQVIVDDTGRVISGVSPSALGTFINLTGDISATGNATALNPVSATLAATGVLAGTYTSVSVDTKGRVLAGSNPTASIILNGDVDGSTLSNGTTTAYLTNVVAAGTYSLVTVDAKGRVIAGGNAVTAQQTIVLTGDVTGNALGVNNTISIVTTLASNVVAAGTYSSVTVNDKGLVTAGSNPGALTGQIVNLTGEVTGTGTGSGNTINVVATLASIATPGTYTSVVIDQTGRVTSGSNPVIPEGAQTVTLTGDVTGTGNVVANVITIATALDSVVTAGTYSSVTVNAKGRVTAGSNVTVNLTGAITGNGTASGNQINITTQANAIAITGSLLTYTFYYSSSSQYLYLPSNTISVRMTVTGAGGSGAVDGTGGAAGGTSVIYFADIAATNLYFSIGVGKGGASVTASTATAGNQGSQTNISVLSQSGGTILQLYYVTGGAGGVPVTTNNGVSAAQGGSGFAGNTTYFSAGPVSIGGDGGPGTGTAGGDSFWGKGGQGQFWSGTYSSGPFDAVNYGAGGGGSGPSSNGTTFQSTSGAGANGVVYVEILSLQ